MEKSIQGEKRIMNLTISNSNTQLLTSGSKSSGTESFHKSSTTYPDLSSSLAVYYSDYDEHSGVLSYIMRYLW